jgi:hypothetical protein
MSSRDKRSFSLLFLSLNNSDCEASPAATMTAMKCGVELNQ